jgi:hypothetical protein
MRLKEMLRGWMAVVLTPAALLVLAAPSATVAKEASEAFTAGIQISEVLQVPSYDPGCQPTDPAVESAALGFINGSGLASAIGAFTLESVDCVRSASPLPYFLPPFNFSSTAFKLITAQGEIVVSYGGTAEMQPTGLLVLKGNFIFTGGTGKFRNVRGGGALLGVENIGTVPATGFVMLSGTISR